MRYQRQIQLKEIGEIGQKKLQHAKVLVVGAGGLGCQVLPLLVGAGVGFIRLYDADIVDESNLHRQTLYRMPDIGQSKALTAKNTLKHLNPYVTIETHTTRLYISNANLALQDIDIVIDAADNFATTYILSDQCMQMNIPLVSASVMMRTGYVGAFCAGYPSYRAIFPYIPKAIGSCNTEGVMGTAVAVIGSMQAQVALSILLEFSPSPLGKLFQFDFSTWQNTIINFHLAEENHIKSHIKFIDSSEIDTDDYVIELRSNEEINTSNSIEYNIQINFEQSINFIPQTKQRTVLVCKTGMRALNFASHLEEKGVNNLAIIAMGI